MGLAVLPSRLKQELTDLAQAVCEGKDVSTDETLEKHALWIEEPIVSIHVWPASQADGRAIRPVMDKE